MSKPTPAEDRLSEALRGAQLREASLRDDIARLQGQLIEANRKVLDAQRERDAVTKS